MKVEFEEHRFSTSRLRRIVAGLCLFLMLFVGAMVPEAMAATYKDQGVEIAIPAGFEGPVSQAEQGGNVSAFVKKYPDGIRGTLLQITVYDFGQALAGMPEDARQEATDTYLAQFLGGIERMRESFNIVSRGPVTLDGIKASRAEWTGEAKGKRMSGVMYCVIVGTRVVAFHTQDFQDAPSANRQEVLNAIKSVKLANQ